VGKSNLIIEGEERSFKEVCQTISKEYQVGGNTKDQYIRCGIQRIRIRTGDHPSKKAAGVELSLVVAQYQNRKSKTI